MSNLFKALKKKDKVNFHRENRINFGLNEMRNHIWISPSLKH